MVSFEDLIGKKLKGLYVNYDELFIDTDDGIYVMYHERDCCEELFLESVIGLSKITEPQLIVAADIVYLRPDDFGKAKTLNEAIIDLPDECEWLKTKTIWNLDKDKDINVSDGSSFTYTFYSLKTNLLDIQIRWYGESNGYYSEVANFTKKDIAAISSYAKRLDSDFEY